MSDMYSAVYRALDASVEHNVCLASSEAEVQRALTRLRADPGNRDAMQRLEQVSIVLQQLALASFAPSQDVRVAAVERLRASVQDWMLHMPLGNEQ